MNRDFTFNKKEYKNIYRKLRTYKDVKRMSSNYPEDFLFVIYTQRTIREVKRRYYHFQRISPAMRRWWKRGETFAQISNRIEFPPVLTTMLILREDGVGRKTFRKYVQEPDTIQDRRIKKELKEVIEIDMIYSPKGHEIQRQRGVEVEEKLANWLDSMDVKYRRENELRDVFTKTPDFLLNEPIWVRDQQIKWVESKGSFGDHREIKTNLKKQLIPYKELFGPGMVIYWYGIVPVETTDGVMIETRRVVDPSCRGLIS